MSVLLFGAGASYGSEEVNPYPPPLGQDLYEALRDSYPDIWGNIPAAYQGKFADDFETAMTELWESGTHDGPVLMRAMGHFFTQFRPRKNNVYLQFIEELDRQGLISDVIFSSLNYECILECSVRQYGIPRINYEPDLTVDGLPVWKLHGSCNFLPAGVSGDASAISYSGSAVTWSGPLEITGLRKARRFAEHSAFYPAMALFAEGKPAYSHPDFLEELQQAWQREVLATNVVAVVGVGVNPLDEHLWGPLAETSARLVCVGDVQAYRAWAEDNRALENTEFLGERFETTYEDLAERLDKESR